MGWQWSRYLACREAAMLWDQRYRDHELWGAVEQARVTMNTTTLPEGQSERDALDYVGMVLELLERRREDTDGREVSPSMLSTAHSAASSFANHIGYAQTGQYAWVQAVPSADDVLTALAQWPPMKMARYLGGINGAVESFQRRTLEAVDSVERQAQEIRESLATLEVSQGKLQDAVEVEKQRISEAIVDFKSEADEAVRDWTAGHEDEVAGRKSRWDDAIAAAQKEAEDHRSLMADYEAKSRKVLEAVGVNATATDFGAYANEQRASADKWRGVAVVVFVFAGGWFIASSFPWFTSGAEMWESALARLGVTAAVAGVGLYVARESSQHRRQERRAKQVQLVLTALEPFIANLAPDEQNKLRVASAEAIFVLRDTPETNADDEALNGLLGLANSLVAKIPDRA